MLILERNVRSTHLDTLITNGIVQPLVFFLIVEGFLIICRPLVKVLQVFVANAQHIRLHLIRVHNRIQQTLDFSYVIPLHSQPYTLGVNIIKHSRCIYLPKERLTFCNVFRSRIKHIHMQVHIAQIDHAKVLLESHIRLGNSQRKPLFKVRQCLRIIFPIVG